MAGPPTVPPPGPENLSSSLKRSIEALRHRRRQKAAAATRYEWFAEAITSFTSVRFVYLHLVVYGAWIAANLGLVHGLPKFDPSFVILAMEASVEAIFLSTFVLISQNRAAAASDKRADLDLHTNLLAEHELTRLAEVVTATATHLDVQVGAKAEIEKTKKDVAPETVLDEIEKARS